MFTEIGLKPDEHVAGTSVDLASPAFADLFHRLTRYGDARLFYPACGTLWIEPIQDGSRPCSM
jgi:hypothetical protein